MMRLRIITLPALLLALLSATVLTVALTALTRQVAVLRNIDHWSADWRTALLADKLPSQHPRLAIVLVDDDTVQALPYRSPIDRALLARLVGLIDGAGAQVIGLDFLFDQPTEPDKDRALITALEAAAPRIVTGTVDDRVPMRAERRQYLADFERRTQTARGFVNLRYEIDDVVRGEADPDPDPKSGSAAALSFAAAVARKAGVDAPAPAPRIAWLGPPRDGSDTFMIVPAGQLVNPADEAEKKLAQMLLAGLKGRVVLVGGDLSDHNDRHQTPLAKLGGGQMPGVVVHAHAVAQRLDRRRLHMLSYTHEIWLVFAMGLAGTLLGSLVRTRSWFVSTLPVVLLGILDAIFFAGWRTILPFAGPVLAWAAGIYIGRAQRWMLRRLNF